MSNQMQLTYGLEVVLDARDGTILLHQTFFEPAEGVSILLSIGEAKLLARRLRELAEVAVAPGKEGSSGPA